MAKILKHVNGYNRQTGPDEECQIKNCKRKGGRHGLFYDYKGKNERWICSRCARRLRII